MTVLLALLALPASACSAEEPCSVHVAVAMGTVEVSDDSEAEDDEVEEQEPEDEPCRRRCRERDPGYATLRVDALSLRDHSAWGVGLRGYGKRDNWMGAEGRWANDGMWMGRFGAGVDLFGRSSIDLGIGLVAGHLGDWQTEDNRRFAVGTELLLAWRPGRFVFEHRHMGGRRPEGRGLRTESHTVLGYRVLQNLEAYVDFATIDPGFGVNDRLVQGEHGVGGGLGLRF